MLAGEGRLTCMIASPTQSHTPDVDGDVPRHAVHGGKSTTSRDQYFMITYLVMDMTTYAPFTDPIIFCKSPQFGLLRHKLASA